MAHVSKVVVEDADCDEQRLNLVLFFDMEIKYFLHGVAPVELGYYVKLLFLQKRVR
jgi:hypothetical protein